MFLHARLGWSFFFKSWVQRGLDLLLIPCVPAYGCEMEDCTHDYCLCAAVKFLEVYGWVKSFVTMIDGYSGTNSENLTRDMRMIHFVFNRKDNQISRLLCDNHNEPL